MQTILKSFDDEQIVINGIDVTDYVNHPRIIELRFISLHHVIEKEFGKERADNYFKAMATKLFNLDWNKLELLLIRGPEIRRKFKSNKEEFNKEIVFMSYLNGESRYLASKIYLGYNDNYLSGNSYNVESFVDQKFLDQLDEDIKVCGSPMHKREVIRFLEMHRHLKEAEGYVSKSKA
jgi:hypothetical protein